MIEKLTDIALNLVGFPLLTAYALVRVGWVPSLGDGWFLVCSIVVLLRVAVLNRGLADKPK